MDAVLLLLQLLLLLYLATESPLPLDEKTQHRVCLVWSDLGEDDVMLLPYYAENWDCIQKQRDFGGTPTDPKTGFILYFTRQHAEEVSKFYIPLTSRWWTQSLSSGFNNQK